MWHLSPLSLPPRDHPRPPPSPPPPRKTSAVDQGRMDTDARLRMLEDRVMALLVEHHPVSSYIKLMEDKILDLEAAKDSAEARTKETEDRLEEALKANQTLVDRLEAYNAEVARLAARVEQFNTPESIATKSYE